MQAEQFQSFFVNPRPIGETQPPTYPTNEVINEKWYVINALPQCRRSDEKSVPPVEQIFAEPFLFNLAAEVAIGADTELWS